MFLHSVQHQTIKKEMCLILVDLSQWKLKTSTVPNTLCFVVLPILENVVEHLVVLRTIQTHPTNPNILNSH